VDTFDAFILGAILNILFNATTGLLNRRIAIKITRWGWLYFLLHATYLLLSMEWSKNVAVAFRGQFGSSTTLSYIVVALVGTLISVAYWKGINRIYTGLFKEDHAIASQNQNTSEKTNQQASPTIDQLLKREAGMSDLLYPTGTVIGGIPWQGNLIDVRLTVITGPMPIQNLDMHIKLNEGSEEKVGIAAVNETSGIPCIFLGEMIPGVPSLGPDQLFGEVKTDKSGNRITEPAPVVQIVSPMYRVQCQYVQKNSVLKLIIAAASIGSDKKAPRRFPSTLTSFGSFETNGPTGIEVHEFTWTDKLEIASSTPQLAAMLSPTVSPSSQPSASPSAPISVTPAASEPSPPKASSLNPYQGFKVHKAVANLERSFTIRPSPFVKFEVPVKIDTEWYWPEVAGHPMVIYIGEGTSAGQDVLACRTFLNKFKEVRREMFEALKQSGASENDTGIASALIVYHAGAFSAEDNVQIRSEARYNHLEIVLLGPTK
jgi:hypothetical protein